MSFGNGDEYHVEGEDDGFWGIPEEYGPYPDGCDCGYWQCSGCGGSPE